MNWQTTASLLIVAVSAIYLAKTGFLAARAFFSKNVAGCSSGCGKCAYSRGSDALQQGLLPVAPRNTGSVIPLSLVVKRDKIDR